MRRAAILGLSVAGGFAVAGTDLIYTPAQARQGPVVSNPTELPSRQDQLRRLSHASSPASPYDLLIIGGGATGTGIALDAATRGLKTAMVEAEDFAAGTSSRSTKLVHGGVRYLEKAFKQFDYGQLKLVFEALHERRTVLDIAPHLTNSLPIMTPCYSWWEVPYYWAGMKMYDLVAGARALAWSHYETPFKAKSQFPTLCAHRADGKTLKGVIMYYDGQFNDSRLAIALACTAAGAGATVLNHAQVVDLIKDNNTGKVIGAKVKDVISGKIHDVYAKSVVNATGPFSDAIRHMSQPKANKMIMPSSGVHITLPDYYSPENIGMIVPKTKDGRVVFMLPWQGETIAGTTDSSSEITMRPQPTEDEIQFILEAISEYLTVKVRRSDVKSAWSGIRPLALDPNTPAGDTAGALRDHVVTTDPDGLITVTGGKWTTYRLMAQDAVNAVVQAIQSPTGPCITEKIPLVGATGWSPGLFTEVAQNYTVPHRPGAIDTRVAKYLASAYGDRAHEITHLAEEFKLGRRLVRGYPVIEAEVVYTCRHEYCETPEDFVARRTRLAFLDRPATLEALPRVVELMAAEKGWSRGQQKAELHRAKEFLKTFEAPEPVPAGAGKHAEDVKVGAVDSTAISR
ncbi:hypothetical protein Ndes2526A_g00159 [Nannochloris sp. 'desiccata']|nr:hypothetical protein KSW81_002970 [Chlorella desiccata (nom. nud.)]